MKAKRAKDRKQRRAWAKSYSRPSGITPNRGVLQDYKIRAAGLGVSEFEVDEYIRQTYNRDPIQGLTPGRVEADQLRRKMMREVPELNFNTLFENCFLKLQLFFNSEQTSFVLKLTNKRKNTFSVSIEYGRKQLAIDLYDQGRVRWKQEGIPVPSE